MANGKQDPPRVKRMNDAWSNFQDPNTTVLGKGNKLYPYGYKTETPKPNQGMDDGSFTDSVKGAAKYMGDTFKSNIKTIGKSILENPTGIKRAVEGLSGGGDSAKKAKTSDYKSEYADRSKKIDPLNPPKYHPYGPYSIEKPAYPYKPTKSSDVFQGERTPNEKKTYIKPAPTKWDETPTKPKENMRPSKSYEPFPRKITVDWEPHGQPKMKGKLAPKEPLHTTQENKDPLPWDKPGYVEGLQKKKPIKTKETPVPRNIDPGFSKGLGKKDLKKMDPGFSKGPSPDELKKMDPGFYKGTRGPALPPKALDKLNKEIIYHAKKRKNP